MSLRSFMRFERRAVGVKKAYRQEGRARDVKKAWSARKSCRDIDIAYDNTLATGSRTSHLCPAEGFPAAGVLAGRLS